MATEQWDEKKLDEEFKKRCNEFIEHSKRMIGKECVEEEYSGQEPPFDGRLKVDFKNIKQFAQSMGDDNPMYNDPEYGPKSIYGCTIAPPTMLGNLRYPTCHAAQEQHGDDAGKPGFYPFSTMYSGACFEWFDIIRLGSRLTTSKKLAEIFTKKGGLADLYFGIYHLNYWDFHQDLLAKAYATMIMTPLRATMETSMGIRRGEVKTEELLYTRGTYKYTPQEMEKALATMKEDVTTRRGAEPLYWEDVNVGDKLKPMLKGPWTVRDMSAYHIQVGAAFEVGQEIFGEMRGARVNPITNWPFAPGGATHEDALLCKQNRFPGPFDFGVQRTMFPYKLLQDWMGDYGFTRTLYMQCRRPMFYGDITWYDSAIVGKGTVVEKGDDEGIPGEETYYYVDIKTVGVNEVGENQAPSSCRVYLPSKEHGLVKLPIPHVKNPPYIPFGKYVPIVDLKTTTFEPLKS